MHSVSLETSETFETSETSETCESVKAALSIFALCLMAVLLASCGYHTAGHTVALLPDVQTLAVPTFTNQTQAYRVEQVLTAAVVREFHSRTKFHVINQAEPDVDATLRGVVLTAQTAPLTYDSQTGRASSALVTVTARVSLVDRKGKILWENPTYTFRQEYQVSAALSSFFEEDAPAMDRLAQDFAASLVSTIVEAY